MSENSLRLGVNYVPSQNWWYSWLDWDPDSIDADLQAVASLHLDHIRIHCLWPYFQPDPAWVSETALDRLAELLDLAGQHNLDVEIAVLDGWLSGFAFYPGWKRGRNMFTDPDMIEAEKRLFRALAERIGNHPRFMGFDLGNELGVLGETVSPEDADRWQRDMLALCDQVAPGKLHVNGVDHRHWFEDTGFSRAALASDGAVTSLHTWIYYTGFLERFGADSPVVEYAVELARAYQPDPDRRIWVQEFGASCEWMPEDAIPDFAEATIRRASTCQGVWGLTWWCSHDLNPKFSAFDRQEYDMGLIDAQNTVKPVGQRVAQVAQDLRQSPPAPHTRAVALVMPDALLASDSPWRLAECFVEHVSRGIHPAIVLSSLAGDSDYLMQRGIQMIKKI